MIFGIVECVDFADFFEKNAFPKGWFYQKYFLECDIAFFYIRNGHKPYVFWTLRGGVRGDMFKA